MPVPLELPVNDEVRKGNGWKRVKGGLFDGECHFRNPFAGAEFAGDRDRVVIDAVFEGHGCASEGGEGGHLHFLQVFSLRQR